MQKITVAHNFQYWEKAERFHICFQLAQGDICQLISRME